MATDLAEHWDQVYQRKAADALSWFQRDASTSLRLLSGADVGKGSLVDVGAGTSTLAEEALSSGWARVTVLDVSSAALESVRLRLARFGERVRFVSADVLTWEPKERFDAWHDRAVFHFLTGVDEQRRYVATAGRAVRPGGVVVMGTFAEDGPTRCSGLPTSRFDAETLAATFGQAFALDRAEREEHVTPAEVVQPFTWVVLRRRGSGDVCG